MVFLLTAMMLVGRTAGQVRRGCFSVYGKSPMIPNGSIWLINQLSESNKAVCPEKLMPPTRTAHSDLICDSVQPESPLYFLIYTGRIKTRKTSVTPNS